jgi:hypothetical protein
MSLPQHLPKSNLYTRVWVKNKFSTRKHLHITLTFGSISLACICIYHCYINQGLYSKLYKAFSQIPLILLWNKSLWEIYYLILRARFFYIACKKSLLLNFNFLAGTDKCFLYYTAECISFVGPT